MNVGEFLNEYWVYILIGLLSLLAMILLISLIYRFFIQETKSFEKTFSDAKSLQFSVCISLEEQNVEIYYLYDQNHENELISLNEFYCRFEKSNLDKIENWLKRIAKSNDVNRTRRVEVVMYRGNDKDVYIVELESYDAENKKYYLTFRDITESINVFRRTNKKVMNSNSSEFIEKAKQRLKEVDIDANNYLIAFKYREKFFAQKELSKEYLKILEEKVYCKIESMKLDNELICLYENGTVLLFSTDVVNIKKYRSHIKKILFINSGLYNLIQNKFSYTINLVAGYTKISNQEDFTLETIFEAEAAATALINKGRFSEKIQLFDDGFRKKYYEENNKLLNFRRIVDECLFTLKYVPVIDKSDKTVNGYYIRYELSKSANMMLDEFMQFVKQKAYGVNFYDKVFFKILEEIDIKNKSIYLPVDYETLPKLMEAYSENTNLMNIKFYFCLEFSNTTMQSTNLITIEKSMESFKKVNSKIRYGITYNNLTMLYLNAKIYSKISVVILEGQLIETALDQYSNRTLIDIYTQIAASYGQDIIGLNVQSLAIYEMLMHYDVNKFGGVYFNSYIENERIYDSTIIHKLEEIETRTY